MDIRCFQCATLYQLEEGEIPAQGAEVICTTCQARFSAYRPGMQPATTEILVRGTDGSVMTFPSAAAAQAGAAAGRIKAADMYLNEARSWMPLATNPTLYASFPQAPPPPAPAPGGGKTLMYAPSEHGPLASNTQPGPAAQPSQPPPAPQPSFPKTTLESPSPFAPPPAQPPAPSPPAWGAPAPAPNVPPPAMVPQSVPAAVSAPGPWSVPSPASPGVPQAPVPSPWGAPPPFAGPSGPGIGSHMPLPGPLMQGPPPAAGTGIPYQRPENATVFEVRAMQRGRNTFRYVLGGAGVAAAIGVIIAVAMMPSRDVPSAAQAPYAEAFAALYADNADKMRAAAERLEAAQQAAGEHAAILSAKAELAVFRAMQEAERREWLIRQIEDKNTAILAAKAANQPADALAAESAALSEQGNQAAAEYTELLNQARKLVARAQEVGAGNPYNFRALALLDGYQGKAKEARGALDMVQAELPGDTLIPFLEGVILRAERKPKEAAKKFEEAIKLNDQFVRARYLLARTQFEDGDKVAAGRAAEFILARNEKHHGALVLALEANPPKPPEPPPEKDGKKDKPKPAPKPVEAPKAPPPAPKPAPAPAPKAAPLPSKPPPEPPPSKPAAPPKQVSGKAEAQYKKHLAAGDSAYENNDFGAAIKAYKQALAVHPDGPEAHFGMAECYKYLGNKPSALEWYQKYVNKFPNGQDHKVAQSNIKRLNKELKKGN